MIQQYVNLYPKFSVGHMPIKNKLLSSQAASSQEETVMLPEQPEELSPKQGNLSQMRHDPQNTKKDT